MIPLEKIWYTLPPTANTLTFYGTTRDWTQGLMTLINQCVYEARERNAYGNNLLDYTFQYDEQTEFIKMIKCNSEGFFLINMLEYYNERFHLIVCRNGKVNVEINEDIKSNVLKYVDGLYENEIILIDEPHKK